MVTYEKFKKLTKENKVALMNAYNAKYKNIIGCNKFTLNEDGTVTIRWVDKSTTTRKSVEELMCADFWKPDQAYDFIEYCHWRMKGCSDDEALCKAMCD